MDKLGQDPAFGQTPFREPDGSLELGSSYFGSYSCGMSIRLYIATAAMQGILSDYGRTRLIPEGTAKKAFELADEMLKQE